MGGLVAVRVLVRFTVKEDFSVPGFTARFVKSSLITADRYGVLKSLLLGGGANKPVGLTPVMRGAAPILKDGEAVLRAGEAYWVRVGVAGGEELATLVPDVVMDAFSTGVTECLGMEVEADALDSPPGPQPAVIHVRTITPAIIKATTPDGGSVTITTPTLKEILASPLRVLGRILWEAYGMNIPTAWAWRITKYYAQTKNKTKTTKVKIKENLKPITATHGEWTYTATAKMPTYLKATLHKTLTIAKTVGIGKSRGIGFGQTQIKTKPLNT